MQRETRNRWLFTFLETNTEIIAAYLDQDTDMRLRDITGALEAFAPLSLQDGFDNAGLQIGLTEDVDTTGVLLCLDVTERIIGDVCRALREAEAVTVAVPVTDTLYIVKEGRLTDVPPRSDFLRAQTPQAFRLSVIADAFRQFMAAGAVQATDDVGVLRHYRPDVSIRIVAGDEANRKLTYAADFAQ